MSIPIFCTADIPASILNTFLECLEEETVEKYHDANSKSTTADYVAFMTSLDISTISLNSAIAPVEAFTSPFLGWSLEQLRNWFKTNITESEHPRCSPFTFIVLDNQSVEDETCLLVDTHRERDEGVVDSARTDFYVPVEEAIEIEYGEWMADGLIGCFQRSDTVMTKENRKLASHGGLYIDGGYEVKLDQYWRDFRNW